MSAIPTSPLLRPGEVARLLAISLPTVYRLARNGELPCIRVGAAIRFRREAVEAFITAHETEAEPRPVEARPSPRRGRPRKVWVP